MVWKCEFFSGWISGMAGLVVGHPMDTIKVRQQLDAKSVLHSVRYITNEGGALAFFRGMGAPLVTNGVMNSMYFGVYGSALTHLSNGREPSYTYHFAAGCAGGLAQLVIAVPVDVLKVQLQSRIHKAEIRGPIDSVKQIIRSQGILGLYKGLGTQFLRDVPSSGIYFLIYEFLKTEFKTLNGKDTQLNQFIAGGLAGTFSWWSILPLDVIKSRIQGDSPDSPKYSGFRHCAKVIYREAGIRGFFQGFWPLSFRAFPVNGTIFIVYEYLAKKCKDHHYSITTPIYDYE